MEVSHKSAGSAREIQQPLHSGKLQSRKLLAHIKKRFPGAASDFELDVEFTAPAGITILFGASGAGKTTLLDCLAGITAPDLGRIVVSDANLFDSERGVNMPVWQRRVGYVFQDLALFPHLTVEQNIRYGLANLPGPEQRKRCTAMMRSFRIEHLRKLRPGKTSGGERQRVALARALVTSPSLLLLDEPLAGLDATTKSHILEDLRDWNDSHQIPILYVTHSREEVFALGERVFVMENGRIVDQGTPHEVMTAPRQETIAQLLGFENILDATVVSAHEERGTMTCRLNTGHVELETPLVRAAAGSSLRVGIRAGDILLATVHPVGLSARNIIPGRLISLVQHDVIVSAKVDCRVEVEVHLTLAARDTLQLAPGKEVWLVVKTHSCHLMAR